MFKGSIVALVTPMTEDERVDYDALADLIEFHIEQGTDGIVTVGTTGESATLDHQEHCEVMRFTVEQVARRIPVIAGTGSNSTREAIELTRCAKEIGADAALLVAPYYNKPTQEGLYQHYKTVAEAVALPQILYNVPGRTACDILPQTVVRLAQIDNIIGIKEATGDLSRVPEIQRRVDSDFMLYTGDDATAIDFILKGGHGGISVTANVAPKAVHDAYAAALAGDEQRAREIDAPLADLHATLFCESNPIPVKWALQRMGKIGPTLRLPLTPLSEACQGKVEAALKTAGVL
ncbi:MAG TPA: 4-hydroxy-tetrahydrodipicolinate synthase [Piscirickettsiaceae bacterium]|nr:4-hydroxy-tetrahydrodipicolinate synthase [Piscirickettsiaceae bacterium]